ncbi:hypothetical protein [Emticicia sp. SJ17W-69]|uniref:hypothetical protein n=1 Tax=Emticicia sp. SJ17W-69 TaxID=3421657 RepID=UPI003EBB96AA
MKILTTLLFFGLSFIGFAQKDSSYYNPNITRKLYYLKPLQKVSGVYFYGDRKLSGVNALEVPFFELNDPEVNHHYKNYKIFTGIGQAISFLPTIYILANLNNTRNRQSGYYSGTYLGILFASLGGSIGCSLIGKTHIKKAAIRYNQAIGNNNISYLQLKTDDNSLGMALRYHF